ncbi:hypothetical protein HBA54_17605 [Pelagibius litoralis]|uniref:Formyl transferase N-terminal domain-containing protein n=1 Tax=Pelagibius litoralis TaxID=374515 RepID=A0A967EZQ4_9PROT|nr:formyl transferase [Pelagibius litoralis]NIA70421.1 hypothetical protein [Pelagibius litoralis]
MEFFESEFPNNVLFPLVEGESLPHEERQLTFAEFGPTRGITSRVLYSLQPPDFEAFVEQFQPEIIISARFSFIFDDAVISSFPGKIINVHPGALPRYAGLFPVFWQLLEGQEKLGCSVHLIDRGIDTGDILFLDWIDANKEKSMLWHQARLYELGVDRAVEAINTLRRGGELHGTSQKFGQRKYFRLPEEHELSSFRSSGFSLINTADYLDLITGFVHTPGKTRESHSVRRTRGTTYQHSEFP